MSSFHNLKIIPQSTQHFCYLPLALLTGATREKEVLKFWNSSEISLYNIYISGWMHVNFYKKFFTTDGSKFLFNCNRFRGCAIKRLRNYISNTK